MGKIKITSTYPPAIWTKADGSKVIVAGTIIAVNNKPWTKGAYVKIKSFVEKSQIVWERSSKTIPVKEMTYTVRGSKGDVYKVTRRTNGSWFCSCTGFHYRKTCRHIQDLTK